MRILDLSGIKGTIFDYFGRIPSIKIELHYVVSLAARKEKDIGHYLCRTIAELVRLSPFLGISAALCVYITRRHVVKAIGLARVTALCFLQ